MKKLLSLILLFSWVSGLHAQDMHFSQGFNFPIIINPALAGAYDGTARLSLSFRNQNIAVPNTAFKGVYNTYGLSGEAKMFPNQGLENTWSVGGLFLNDFAGSGSLATIQALAFSSYAIALDRYGQSFLSIGAAVGLNNRRIFSNDLLFESQVNGFEFDPSLPNLEPYLDGSAFTTFSLNLGVMYQQQLGDMIVAQMGLGMFNVNRPKNLFITNSEENVYARIAAHGGLLMMLDDYSALYPSIIYMNQGPARQLNVGISYQNQISDDVKLIVGLRSRIQDAFIILAGMDYKRFVTTVSYDLTTSTLSQANKSSGAFELNLTYIFGEQEASYGKGKMYCPSF